MRAIIDECDMEEFGTLDSSEKTIAMILGDRWWPQAAIQEGDKISKKSPCSMRKRHNGRQKCLEASPIIRSTNGAPSRKGCAVNGQMIKAS